MTTIKPAEKRIYMICAGVVIAALLAMLYVFVSSGDTPTIPPNTPQTPVVATQTADTQQDLTGDWSTVSNGVEMVATVKDSKITVVIKSRSVDVTFWSGSFENSGAQGDTIASLQTQNPDVIMVDSSTQTQVFVVGDRTLSFDASMMGVTKHITLTHV